MLQILGLLGGLFTLASSIFYIKDTLLLKVKPQRASFFIWALLGTIALFSQLAKGASNSLWLPGLQTFGGLTIFILSIKYGMGGFSKKDYTAILIAIIGLIIWYFTKEAAIALYIVMFIDFTGLVLVLNKAYVHPESETNFPWMLSAFGGFLALLSVGSFNIVLLTYPFYTALANAAVVVAKQMGLRRK